MSEDVPDEDGRALDSNWTEMKDSFVSFYLLSSPLLAGTSPLNIPGTKNNFARHESIYNFYSNHRNGTLPIRSLKPLFYQPPVEHYYNICQAVNASNTFPRINNSSLFF